jgi:PAS domain S-box-containing protein
MEKPQPKKKAQLEPRKSGVRPNASHELLAQLDREIKAADQRIDAFRADMLRAHAEHGELKLGALALHEIDVAHEELRVVEEELHSQADEILGMRELIDAERRRYNELFEAAPEAYVVTDAFGSVIEANRRAGLLFNLDQVFFSGKPLATFVAPVDRERFRELLAATREGRQQLELRVQPRQGRPSLWAALTAEPATAAGGRGAVIRWMMRDIDAQKARSEQQDREHQVLTERVRELEDNERVLEAELERARTENHRANEIAHGKEQVLAEVAHELRSPLATIAGWLHVLTQTKSEPSAHLRALLSMTRGVRLLAHQVEHLIEHTRFEQHAVKLDPTTFNLLRMLADLIEDVRPVAELKDVAIGFNAHPPKVDVHADAWRLAQAFRNLIGNAIKFTPEHGVVNINVRVGRHRATVTITDTGRGIPLELLDSIFEPFKQALVSGGRPTGLGLGLSIAKRYIELHGGTITAHSEGSGSGATFLVVLPLLAPN